jgi:hypothetical protein
VSETKTNNEQSRVHVATIQIGSAGPAKHLYKQHDLPLLEVLMKGDEPEPNAPSRQSVSPGRKWHPFDMKQATQFQVANIHHSTCLHAKVASTVGMGFETDKVSDALDKLCEVSFQSVLQALGEDYFQIGGAWLEVIRRDDPSGLGEITGLHWLPGSQVYVVIEDEATYDRHYEVESREGAGNRIYAKFGDLAGLKKRMAQGKTGAGSMFMGSNMDGKIAELIYIPRPSTLSRWYGMPDWLAATATIELAQMHKQHFFDFYNNRGVAEFLLFVLNANMSEEDGNKITSSLKGNIGSGNRFKSNFFQINGDETTKVQLEHLAQEDVASQFAPLADVNAQEIVSAHRVPPLLAGIQIPGKMGAVNELPNALVAFQILVIGPAQKNFQTILGNTLGNPKLNGGLGLKKEDFNLHEITAQLDIAAIDTAARMQDEVSSPRGKARLEAAGVQGADKLPGSSEAPRKGLGGVMLKDGRTADLVEHLLEKAQETFGDYVAKNEHEARILQKLGVSQ